MRRSESPLDILIVGAGISGIGMAAHVRRALPHKKIAIVERRQRIGGTWDLFRYPGVRSDSDMYTLGFSFAPWRGKRAVATGEEILGYLDSVIEAHDLRGAIHAGTTVRSADWSDAIGLWTVAAQDEGGEYTLTTRFLFIGAGYYDYDEPAAATIPGLERFAGRVIHPQAWPTDADWAGKHVVVIGSGATAVTLTPAMARDAAQVTMLQRTPSWFYAQPGTDKIAQVLNRVLPAKWAYRLVRYKNVALQDYFFRQSRKDPEGTGAYLQARLRNEIGAAYDPASMTPPYGPWRQRLCFVPDSDLFAAMRDGRARLVTGEIAQVEPHAILLRDGRRLPADVIVTATGLRLAPLGKIAVSIDGEPVRFAEHWYYRSCMFSNVPNFAALFGYLNAAWTLRVDLVGEWLCRLFAQMDAWDLQLVTPLLPADHALVEADPLAGFTSSYLQQGRHLIPKSARGGPWRLSHDYPADRREMREAPIDDGWLAFRRVRVAGERQLS
ncbi:NAD(P)/FAD-dependent oxidoreductase [Novosphingobium sp. 9U]|uniref:flavin-containing monooxygenase n=1 Tax=Novosphingobium sp. 9U TaxID=2653158 RepID=UPI0012F0C1F2|nr:NAD(P)/FAD-dependent oxidoreductase [Novosphingobium sp. 9U]VWX47107.1 Baeyer-Villiger monooxygenase [Novosphingobium sp. 9U]